MNQDYEFPDMTNRSLIGSLSITHIMRMETSIENVEEKNTSFNSKICFLHVN